MTKKFDALLEQFLSEWSPADIGGFEGGAGGAAKHIEKGIPEGAPKGHWAPLQKLPVEDRQKIIRSILDNVFSEKENTYSPTVSNPKELHAAIQASIKSVASETALAAKAEYASKFLADRMMTLLKGSVKYTTAGGEEIQKDVTQKEFKQALTKALEEKPEEKQTDGSEEESKTDENKVYIKAPDWSTDDSDLLKIFNKLPDNKEMSWEEVISSIKTTPALNLLDAGGLIETEKEESEQEGEEEYGSEHKDLEIKDDDEGESRGYEGNFERAMKDLDPHFSTTRKLGGSLGWD